MIVEPPTIAAVSPKLLRGSIVALVVVALCAALVALARIAATQLHQRVALALGPRASLESISLSWSGDVELRGLRIAAARGWPAADELRAARVRIVPSLRSAFAAAFGSAWHVERIEIDGAYLSLHRTRDGTLRVLPALLGGAPAATTPRVIVGSVRVEEASIDCFDSSLKRGAAHRVRLAALDAELGPLALPALDEAIEIDLAARLEGPRHAGRLQLAGRVTPSTRDAALQIRAHGVDLVALQPYLLKAADAGVKRGRLDLQMDASVRALRLDAPGTLTLTDLELEPGSGALGTLAGVPRQAVLAALKRDGRIDVRFKLEGRLDDPSFSLDERLATRVASGLAESLGVSIGGVVEGVGSVIKGLLGR